jgi:hypothetical protein
MKDRDKWLERIDQRFDQLERKLDSLASEVVALVSKEISQAFGPYFARMERMVANHEARISELEQKTSL